MLDRSLTERLNLPYRVSPAWNEMILYPLVLYRPCHCSRNILLTTSDDLSTDRVIQVITLEVELHSPVKSSEKLRKMSSKYHVITTNVLTLSLPLLYLFSTKLCYTMLQIFRK